jgi:hypothetical protein
MLSRSPFRNRHTKSPIPMQTSPRIPVALQSVILASNRGNEVVSAPPLNVASKTFRSRRGVNQASPVGDPCRTGVRKTVSVRSSAMSMLSRVSLSSEKLRFSSPRRAKSNDLAVQRSPVSAGFLLLGDQPRESC